MKTSLEEIKMKIASDASDIDKIIDKLEDILDANTAPTGGGYEADYTDKNKVLSDFRNYLNSLKVNSNEHT